MKISTSVFNPLFCWKLRLCSFDYVVEMMVTFSKSSYGRHLASQDCCCPCPRPCGRPLLTHASAGDPQTLTGRFGSVSPLPISWCTQGFRCALQGSMVSIKLTLSIIVHLLTSSYSFSSVLGCGALFFFFFGGPNSDLNWRKWGKRLDHSDMT